MFAPIVWLKNFIEIEFKAQIGTPNESTKKSPAFCEYENFRFICKLNEILVCVCNEWEEIAVKFD